ncbi:MAG: sugar kinase [Candidatus Marinimicrobia bacterium]|nr:sugar kinase [Candidatus Neomarinimicrobiota bacterium]MCF7829216.1 sugar kinase [Candidatus Neomarinimicrobiota bacterium]MCF7881131.1 sugar kinase [Candidatus Neomarinimicrobiota bacterium]
MAILVVGSVALDTIETPFDKREEALGGSAMYFSVAASYFSRVQMVGVVGTDFPEDAVTMLQEKGVDITGLQQVEGRTFRWSGRYHYDMNQRDTLDTQLNVFEEFTPEIPDKYKSTEYLFLANIHPALQLDVLGQVNDPALVITDTMNLWINTTLSDLKKVIARTDILLISDSEIRLLTEEPNLLVAAKMLLKEGPEVIIIKKGEHGAMMVDDSAVFFTPGFPLENIVDPTGAGDVFAGGLVGHLERCGKVNKKSLRQAVVYGSVMASFNVEDFSLDNLRSLEPQAIHQRYKRFYELTTFDLE